MHSIRIRRAIPQLALCLATCSATGIAQQAPNPSPAKSTAFDVVSIRPNNSGNKGGAWGVWKNEYSAKNTPLGYIILEAYLGGTTGSPDRLKGAPSWVMTDGYDIKAKVDDATADSWKGLRQAQQVAIAAPMLRAMLEDRCKLVVHTVPTQIPAYALVLGKRPLKLKEAQPDEGPPKNLNYGMFEGGWMIVYPPPGADVTPYTGFRKVTMAEFTEFMTPNGPPIIDQTGLKGTYDFDLPRLDTPLTPAQDGAPPPPRPMPDKRQMFDWQSVGLELKPLQVPAVDIVIDHIERPTEN